MKSRFFAKILTGLVIIFGVTTINTQPSVAQNQRYTCSQLNGTWHTFVQTQRGNIPMINWVSEGWNVSQRNRCIQVSNRFQSFSDNGLLRYIRAGEINNYPVICVANSIGGACPSNNVLFTLQPDQDAHEILAKLLDLRRLATENGINLTDDIFFYDQGDVYIDLDNFIQQLESSSQS